jgi:hypothetical protein
VRYCPGTVTCSTTSGRNQGPRSSMEALPSTAFLWSQSGQTEKPGCPLTLQFYRKLRMGTSWAKVRNKREPTYPFPMSNCAEKDGLQKWLHLFTSPETHVFFGPPSNSTS